MNLPITPKFSIITCTWNSEPYLEQSIASVLSQDYPEIEYIFVDGGSTDGTLERIAAINRPVKVLHGVRGGIAHAMNAGIRAATGNIIAHMHSDDYYLASVVLSRVARAFGETGRAWLFGRIFSDIDGNLERERYRVPRYSYHLLQRRNMIPHAATFVRRIVFEELGLFDEDFRLAMDYEFWLRIGKSYEPLQLDDYLAVFRCHRGSATAANRLKSLNEDFKARFRHARWSQYPEFALRYPVRRLKLWKATHSKSIS